MMIPTVHLNGTSKAALEYQYADALSAVNAALDALAQAAPNARDYYVQTGSAYSRAADEHDSRMQRLASVRDELLKLYEAVEDQ